jgi:AmmeMemoRadiSam system protein B
LLAIVCPHQPPLAAATLLDATLRELPPAETLDAVVILGTSHGPGRLPFALTQKPYRTPLHTAPAADALFSEIIEQVSWATREEILHRGGHSVELATLLLHYLYGPACPPILPILCAPLALAGGDASEAVDHFLAAMERTLGRRRVLLWASAELGHEGPAFSNDPRTAPAVTPALATQLERRDRAILDGLAAGRPEQLQRECSARHDTLGGASGSPVLVTLARLLPIGYRAELVEYRLQPPPGDEDGLVGLAGVRVYNP